MAFISELLMIVASYLGVFILTVIAINWLLGGLFAPYVKVRGSRGKLVLVKVKNMVSDYFRTGTVEERFLVFKDRKKEVRRIVLPAQKMSIYRSLGVSCIDIDDEKNAVVIYDNTLVIGFDAVKFNDLYTRALFKPSLVDNKMMILIILGVVNFIGICVLGLLIYQDHKLLVNIGTVTKSSIETLPK